MRLAKYLADAGVASRRKAEKLIVDGRISINGALVSEPGRVIDPDLDIIEFDGQMLKPQNKIYLILNKPAGYLSSTYDPQGRPTVMDLLKGIQGRLYPVGRLDLDTRGLLLLSNDGEFTNKMIHPRYQVDKKYQALVKGRLSQKALRQLSRGVELEDGLTSGASVKVLELNLQSTLIEMVIHEGRKRQVKRMLAHVGFPVISLKRTALAFLVLGNLKEGEYRHLHPGEVKGLLDLAQSGVTGK
ncbi:MAG: rRNA pseudouridine synthase [Syntrophomonadaceae bacterium]|jgi:23S rRNA pseudouridine2605 synthase|nr:rRNA pseudouridine synthase [Syntrophomonadaceae bacterium]